MKRNRLFVIIVVSSILYIGVRLGYLIINPVQVRDAFVYQDEIIGLNDNNFVSIFHTPPLALFLMGRPNALWGYDIMKGAIIVNEVVGLGLLIVLILISYRIARSILLSALVGVIVATHPSLVYYSSQMTRENIYLLFCSLFLLTIISAARHKYSSICFCSFFAAMCSLCRYEGFELIIVFFVISLFGIKSRNKIKTVLMSNATFLILFSVFYVWVSNAIGAPQQYNSLYLKFNETFASGNVK